MHLRVLFNYSWDQARIRGLSFPYLAKQKSDFRSQRYKHECIKRNGSYYLLSEYMRLGIREIGVEAKGIC